MDYKIEELEDFLNDEVEIIEEKKIEKMKYYDYLDKSKIIDKINEIIEVINNEKRFYNK